MHENDFEDPLEREWSKEEQSRSGMRRMNHKGGRSKLG